MSASTHNYAHDHSYLGGPWSLNYAPISSMYQDGVKGAGNAYSVREADTSKLTDPSSTATDFPPTNKGNGNSMVCLENALLQAFGQSHLGGAAREQKLAELREQVIEFKGKLLRAGDHPNSPIVVDTDVCETNRFYKFLVSWEMKVRRPDGGEVSITKKQWVTTAVLQPNEFNDTQRILFAQHRALLAVKCQIFLLKHAFNKNPNVVYPIQNQHERILRCIDDVRKTYIVGIQGHREGRLRFSTDICNVECKHDPDTGYLFENTISTTQPASSLCVSLRNASGKKVTVFIDQAFTGRRLKEDGSGYDKLRYHPDLSARDVIPLCIKRQIDAHGMLVRGNQDLTDHLKALRATPDELRAEQPFEGRNARGMTFRQVSAERYAARSVGCEAAKTRADRSKKELEQTIANIFKQRAGSLKTSFKTSFGMKFKKDDCVQSMVTKMSGQTLTTNQREQLTGALNAFQNAVAHLKREELCCYILGSNGGIYVSEPRDRDYAKYDGLIAQAQTI